MRLETVIMRFSSLTKADLINWIDRGFLRPEPVAAEDWVFQEIDIARVQLIIDLRHEMGVEEETLPLVLSLLDQLYELRSQFNSHLKGVARALDAQSAEVRAAILSSISSAQR
jgi:chaperone modulatory protein CbpM